MYTLFWEKGSGSIAVQAALEEVGAEYDTHYVDMAAEEHRESDYLAQNPTGLVPALTLPDKITIGESAAIVTYLAERHAEHGLMPPAGEPDHARFLYWLLYMASSGYPAFGQAGHPERYTTDEDATESVRVAALDSITRIFDVLDQGIEGDPFFLASGFSALDLYLSMLTEWHPDREALFRRNPRVAALYRAVAERPSYRSTLAFHA